MKLWDKGYELDERIEHYTVGNDPELDHVLLPGTKSLIAEHIPEDLLTGGKRCWLANGGAAG